MSKNAKLFLFSTAIFMATSPSLWAESEPEVSPTEDTVQTTQASDATTATSQDVGETVEEQLSLGEEEQPKLSVGQPYTAEVNADWELRCVKAAEDQEDPCQMYQLMKDSKGDPVAEFSLFRLPKKGKAKAGATVVVPLETSLPQQLTISVDGANSRRYPYAFCGTVGCYARIGLTADDVTRFKRGNVAKITIVPAFAQGQKVELELSLSGFTASYDKVSVLDQ